MELWDAYYKNGALAGKTLVRGEKIPEGLCHAVAEVFVMHRDGSILLMQRDYSKESFPGYYESTAGGAVLKGESFERAARRELFEETGIIAGELQFVYREFGKNYIVKGFLCIIDIDKDSIVLQPGETISFKWVDKETFLKIYESDEFVPTLRERLRTFVKNDFVTEKNCCFEKDKKWFRFRAAGIIIEEGCILMAKNAVDDYYYSIGGGVHMGEDSISAVKREVFEETGIHYEVDRLAFINEAFFMGDGSLYGKECHVVEFFYLMKPRGTKEINSNSFEFGLPEDMCWLPTDKLDDYKLFPLFYKDKLKQIPEVITHYISKEY